MTKGHAGRVSLARSDVEKKRLWRMCCYAMAVQDLSPQLTKGIVVDTREAYMEKFEAKLKEWEAKNNVLKAEAQQLKAQAKIAIASEMDTMHEKYEAAGTSSSTPLRGVVAALKGRDKTPDKTPDPEKKD